MGTATLRNLWKLNNPFTSDSYELQQAYRQELVQKFSKMNSDSWVTVARTVADSLMPLLVRADNTVSCNVKNISRHVTLAAVLTSLFDINEVETERLAYIGDEIHRLTVGKKQYDAGASTAADLPLDMQQAAERLIENLRDLFADAKNTSQLARTILCSVSGTTDDFNPLNLVIPAFEAPWRAIYYTLLAILQSDCQARIQDITALLVSEPQSSPHPAVLAVMYESLRMYPPIRRVRRDHRVDIEAIQRDTKYWGGDADTFDPRRFLDNCGRIKTELIGAGSAWMPFAVGSMKCPSAGGYSARFMVVVISEVLRQLFLSGDKHGQLPNWRLDGPEWDHAAKSGQALRSGRDEYASVRLIVYP
ncbi:hypothetical protein TCE0_044f16153 [Talaromyces pinophilus]|uniref:Cytochrome P450 n=1 Tax=Talaromyces pinophilus TaxID=128442 RepID=A0A478EAB8_TALPI|nr:hypothetical protein TCE0_044f16153 [Talaromyces pinophilus]